MQQDHIAIAVGARIRRQRKSAGLTIEKLAERAGVGAVYLGNVERGTENPSLKILAAVATALGSSIADLVNIEADLSDTDVRRELAVRLKKASPADLRRMLRILDAVR